MSSVRFQPLAMMRRLARPSTVARALWLSVALLHAWLAARRLVLGEWAGPLDVARGTLCLAGVGYGSLKFWQVAVVLDAAPRRAMAFALILVLGHGLLAVPRQGIELRPLAPRAMQTVAILSIVPALGTLLLLARAALRHVFDHSLTPRRAAPLWVALDRDRRPPIELRRAVFFFLRPPPLFS